MVKLKQFIEKISNKKNIKIVLIFFLILGCFVGFSFADGAATSADTSGAKDSLAKIFYCVFSVLSWLWIVLANLAGKFMTNDFVYGTFLHLDSTLWTFWNIMKNLANFALGVLVLVSIAKSLFTMKGLGTFSDKGINSPLSVIKNTVIAGVLIQMSWFLVAVVIDISSICVAAIGSFPSQLIASNNELMVNFRSNLENTVGNTVIVDYKNETHPIRVVNGGNQNLTDEDIMSLFDTLMPSSDSLSGPLIYLGLSVFKFRDFNVQEVSEDATWGSLFLSIGFDGLILLFYSVLMLLLFLFNLFRIIILWLIIPAIPIIILIKVFDLKLFDTGVLKEVSDIKNIIKLIFKPVIMVGTLSLVLIVILLIRGIISSDVTTINIKDENLSIVNEQNSDGTYNTSMDVDGFINVVVNGAKDSFADILVYILGLCLICFLVTISKTKTGIAFVDKPIGNLFDKFKTFAGEIPIVPIPGGNITSVSNINKYFVNNEELFTKKLGINPSDNLNVIDNLLKLDSNLSRLKSNLSKKDFIEQAKKCVNGKTYDAYTKTDQWREFQEKVEEWNTNHMWNQITMADIFGEKVEDTSQKKSESQPTSGANPNENSNTP